MTCYVDLLKPLLALLGTLNGVEDDVRSECIIISIDVKVLYPSISWDEIVHSVKVMMNNSKMVIDDVDWREVSKYVAVMVPREEIDTEVLSLVIPKRKKIRTQNVTINYQMQENKLEQFIPFLLPSYIFS